MSVFHFVKIKTIHLELLQLLNYTNAHKPTEKGQSNAACTVASVFLVLLRFTESSYFRTFRSIHNAVARKGVKLSNIDLWEGSVKCAEMYEVWVSKKHLEHSRISTVMFKTRRSHHYTTKPIGILLLPLLHCADTTLSIL